MKLDSIVHSIACVISVCAAIGALSGCSDSQITKRSSPSAKPQLEPVPYNDVLESAFSLVIRARGKEKDLLQEYGATDPRTCLSDAGIAKEIHRETYRQLVTWSIAGVIRHGDWRDADAQTKMVWSREGIELCLHHWRKEGFDPSQTQFRELTWEEAEERAANMVAGANVRDLQEGFTLFGLGDNPVKYYCAQTGEKEGSLSPQDIQDILVWSLAGLLRHSDAEDVSDDVRKAYIQEGLRHLLSQDRSPQPYP